MGAFKDVEGEPAVYAEIAVIRHPDQRTLALQPVHFRLVQPIESHWHNRPDRAYEIEIQMLDAGTSTDTLAAALKAVVEIGTVEPGEQLKEDRFKQVPWLQVSLPELANAKRPVHEPADAEQWRLKPYTLKVVLRESRTSYKALRWFGEAAVAAKADIQKVVREEVVPAQRRRAADAAEDAAYAALGTYFDARAKVRAAKAAVDAERAKVPAPPPGVIAQLEQEVEQARVRQGVARRRAEEAYAAAGLGFPAVTDEP